MNAKNGLNDGALRHIDAFRAFRTAVILAYCELKKERMWRKLLFGIF